MEVEKKPRVDCFLFDLLSSSRDQTKFSKSIQALEKAFYKIFWYGLEWPIGAISGQGGIKCAITVLLRNCICCYLRSLSGVIIPSFDGNSNIFATFIEENSYR